jgi:hypothetical protein
VLLNSCICLYTAKKQDVRRHSPQYIALVISNFCLNS